MVFVLAIFVIQGTEDVWTPADFSRAFVANLRAPEKAFIPNRGQPCEQPSSMDMDRKHGRVFIGCRSGVMAVVDGDSGRIVTTQPIGEASMRPNSIPRGWSQRARRSRNLGRMPTISTGRHGGQRNGISTRWA